MDTIDKAGQHPASSSIENLAGRQIAESLPQLVWSCTPTGECDYLSRQWVEYTGIPESEQWGFDWLEQVHPHDRQNAAQAWKAAFANNKSYDIEFRLRRFDGVYRWFKTRGVPLRDAQNQIVRWFGTSTDIEDLKLAERAARESERLFHGVFSQQFQFLAVLSPQGYVLEINDSPLQAVGITRDQVIGHLFWDTPWWRDLPAIREEWPSRLQNAAQHDGPVLTEDEFQDAAGQIHTADASVTAVRDTQGEVEFFIIQARDTTAQKRAAVALRESEERFRATFEQAAVGIAHVSLEGHFLRVNQKLCDILGYESDELMNLNFDQITHPDDLHLHPPAMKKLLAGEIQDLLLEKRYLHKNGTAIWTTVTVALRRNEDGSPRYFISVIEDISTRKRAEEALRLLAHAGETLGATLDAETTLRELVDLMLPDWADWADVQYIEESEDLAQSEIRSVAMRHVNAQKEAIALEVRRQFVSSPVARAPFLEMLRQGEPLLLDQNGVEALTAGAGGELHQLLQQMEVRSAVITPLLSHTTKEQKGRPRLLGYFSCLLTQSERRYDEQDVALFTEIARRAGSAIDRANLYAEAQRARDAAEKANRAKDEFLSVVSHELRTPLTPIMGWVSLLRGPMEDTVKNEALDIIERNLAAQVQIISDILDTTRITSDKLHLELCVLPVAPLVHEALEPIYDQAKAKNVAVFIDLPANPGTVQGDSLRLRQVLWNLLTNAIKFTPPGGRIEVKARRDQTHVEISVKDSGIGIEAEFLPYVFERFRQADSSHTREHGGLGLGLNIVHHLTALHGGTVRAESAGVNQGATFIVRLPLCDASPDDTSLAPDVAMSGTPGKAMNQTIDDTTLESSLLSLEGQRILVVDDEIDTGDLVTIILRQQGAEARFAPSASEARTLLETWKPNLLISDLAMPGEDGFALLSWLRSQSDKALAQLPAIALSACATEADRDRTLSTGFSRHLAKPVLPDDLVRVVVETLKK
ncbi:MAG TPA: PAS domain S-box protein [Abditibacteriaceae bacterium]|jgi:PAS domain S-box-containing protein